jgi:hypothetical protein
MLYSFPPTKMHLKIASVKFKLLCGLFLVLTIYPVLAGDSPGLRDTTILIIRHAEKPDAGYELAPAGQERAGAYVNYFKTFTLNGKPLTLDYLISAADSKGSHRPRLTIEPLSAATGLAIDHRFNDKEFQALADDLQSRPHGKHILICWHHGEIPQLVRALGADPVQLIHNAKWPEHVFGWVIELRYDGNGQLREAKRIDENLMPDDTAIAK